MISGSHRAPLSRRLRGVTDARTEKGPNETKNNKIFTELKHALAKPFGAGDGEVTLRYHYGMTADAALKQFAAQHSTGVLYYQIQ